LLLLHVRYIKEETFNLVVLKFVVQRDVHECALS